MVTTQHKDKTPSKRRQWKAVRVKFKVSKDLWGSKKFMTWKNTINNDEQETMITFSKKNLSGSPKTTITGVYLSFIVK